MKVFTVTNKENIKSILSKYIRNKTDFENLINRVSEFITFKENHNKNGADNVPENWIQYLALIDREMILPYDNVSFLPGLTIPTRVDYDSVLKSFLNGRISEKKYLMIHDFNFKVYYGVSSYGSYKNLKNIEDEIARIINDVDIDNIFSDFLTQEMEVTNITKEFLTVNDSFAEMFRNGNAVIYSAIVNYSRSDLKRNPEICNFLFNTTEPLENWDDIRKIFLKFLKEINTRTIHY